MRVKRQTLYDFIHESFNDKEKAEGAEPAAMALCHQVGMKQVEVDSVRFTGTTKWDLKVLSERFLKRAENYAEELPGVQQFWLNVIWPNQTEPQARKGFRVTGVVEGNEDGSTESPTSSGLTQQAMRHTEVMVQTMTRQMGMVFDATNNIIDQVQTEKNALRRENMEQFQVIMDMMKKQMELTMESRMEEMRFRRQSEDRAALMRFVPSLVNSVTGKEIFTESTEDTALIETIASKLTPQQMQQIGNILPPEVAGPLATRIKKFYEQREEMQDDGRRRLVNGIDPELEVSGEVQ